MHHDLLLSDSAFAVPGELLATVLSHTFRTGGQLFPQSLISVPSHSALTIVNHLDSRHLQHVIVFLLGLGLVFCSCSCGLGDGSATCVHGRSQLNIQNPCKAGHGGMCL